MSLQARKLAVGPGGADSKWRKAQDSLLATHFDEHLLVYACVFRCVRLLATPWTVARQAPWSMGILQARTLGWVAVSFSRGPF